MHNITERDGMFTVRKPAWHYGETKHHIFADYPTREEAQRIAFGWNPITEPLYRAVPVVTDSGPETRYEEVKETRAVVRDDNNDLIGTVSSTLADSLVTNDVLFDVAEAIEGNAKDVKYETGGSLKGGRKVWLLLRLNEPINLTGREHGEAVIYFALQNSNDGSGAFRGQGLASAIVCDNTAQFADVWADSHNTEFVFRHTKSIHDRIEQAKEALAGWRENVDEYQRFVQHLLTIKVTKKQRQLYVAEFVPMPPKHLISDRVVANVEEARATIHSIIDGPTIKGAGIDRTAYGLIQASIEYGQHYRKAQSEESRFNRAYLKPDRLARDAFALAQQVVTA
jgi:phage/plasmid-like protein (TIGR03299 family)